jgi:hypothetical protein
MNQSRDRRYGLGRSIGGWVGTGLIGSTLLLLCPATPAATLSAWQFDPATQQFTVTLPRDVTPRFLVAAEPARIILEIPQTQLGRPEGEQRYEGPVQSVRLAQVDADTLQVVLELAPGTVLDPDHAQLTALEAGDQTRWVLTPLIAEAGTVVALPTAEASPLPRADLPQLPRMAPVDDGGGSGQEPAPEDSAAIVAVPSLPPSTAAANVPLTPPPEIEPASTAVSPASPPVPQGEMIVELPVIPAAESGFGFPKAGQGRLSTTAANLMLPSDLEGLENLPETLPIDPFSIGMTDTEQVSVPGLDELDAVTGPLATVPQAALPEPTSATATGSPAAAEFPGAAAAGGEAITVVPPVAPSAAEPSSDAIAPIPAAAGVEAPDQRAAEITPEPESIELTVVPAASTAEPVAPAPSTLPWAETSEAAAPAGAVAV